MSKRKIESESHILSGLIPRGMRIERKETLTICGGHRESTQRQKVDLQCPPQQEEGNV